MSTARLDIQLILKNFQHCYQQSLLECALTYLETGDEQLTATIGLRAQYIRATSACELACIQSALDSHNIPEALIGTIEAYTCEPTTIVKAKANGNWHNLLESEAC